MRKFLPVAIIAALLAGCSGGLIRPRVEKGIRESLPGYIGPAKEYTVRADGSTTNMIKGLIERLTIDGKDVQLNPMLLVSHIVVEMTEIRYHTSSRELKSVGSTTFKATVAEEAINNYIKNSYKDNYNMKVNLREGKIVVDLAPEVLGINMPISVTGKPSITNGDKVSFVADAASISRLPVPSYIVNKALDRINPILDMAAMNFPVSLKAIDLKDKVVDINGSAEFKTATN